MLSPSKWLPLSIVGLGTLMVVSATIFLLLFQAPAGPASVPIPDQVSGLPMVSELSGTAALKEFYQLHGQSFPVISGAKASYGAGNQITLWVAGTSSELITRQLQEAMHSKLEAGNSPFRPTTNIQEGGRMIYALDGMGQKHFYFLSGKYLIWLATNSEKADSALQEALNFYR